MDDVRQESTSGCAGCRERDARIAELERRVAALEGKLAEVVRESQRQTAKFPRRKLIPPGEHKRSGRKPGHDGAFRAIPKKVHRTIHVPCVTCPECRVKLVEPQTRELYQTDIPPIEPQVTKFVVQGGTCPCCGKYRQGRHEEQITDPTPVVTSVLGPRVLGLAADWKHRLGIVYRKISELFGTCFSLKVSPGALSRAEIRFAQRALPTYEWLVEALRQAGVVHADETGWRVSRRNAWLWVFASKDITIYAIRFSRGHEVPAEMLGDDFSGVLIVDGLSSYDVLECVKGRCVAHILRRARGLTESDALPQSDREHVESLITLLKHALDIAAHRDDWAASTYSRKVARVERDFEMWLTAATTGSRDADVKRLAKHLREHRHEWFLFLYDPDIPATNNHGERQIRPGVLLRKLGSCHRELLHALAHEITASLTTTCRQRGHPFLELARSLWLTPQPHAFPIPA
jgi:hypothetical protein